MSAMDWVRSLTRWRARRADAGIRNDGGTLSTAFKGSDLYAVLTGGLTSAAGVQVTEANAMRVSAVYACVSRIGGAIASLPLHHFTRANGKKERVRNSTLWQLLNNQPSDVWGAATFWGYLTQSRLLHGDAFAAIKRPAHGSTVIAGFEALHPLRVSVQRTGGRLFYRVIDPDTGEIRGIDQADMIHVPGPGFDGTRGLSVIRHALQNSAGIALAADEYSAKFFANGARPDFVLTTEGAIKPEQLDLMRTQWEERYGGVGNSHKPAVLVNGLKAQQLSMNSAEAQLLQARGFQIEDIARIFGVPPFMIGHTEKTTSWGSGVEQMSIGFVKYTLQPHLTAFEQEFNRKCFDRRSPDFLEFSVEGLLRGDSSSRSSYYRAALGGGGGPGWMTPNEVRALENLPPIDGGDALTVWDMGQPGNPEADAPSQSTQGA